jgi:hypothetical protein
MMTGFNSKKAMANDRMAELIKEATALAWVDRIANGPVPMYAEEHMIKLAELIIQECLNICEELGDKGMDGHYCADEISKTFRS